MVESESLKSLTDRLSLEERAASAFAKLESILHSHELRLKSEKARREELEAIENRMKDLKTELGSLLSPLQPGWEAEMSTRYNELLMRQRKIHDNIFQEQLQLEMLQSEERMSESNGEGERGRNTQEGVTSTQSL